jgi:hypothetical protein
MGRGVDCAAASSPPALATLQAGAVLCQLNPQHLPCVALLLQSYVLPLLLLLLLWWCCCCSPTSAHLIV